MSYAVGQTRKEAYAAIVMNRSMLNMLIRFVNPADGENMALLDNWIFKIPVGNIP